MWDVVSYWLILAGVAVVKETVTAGASAEVSPALVLECGSSAAIPANISHYGGRQVGGLYTSEKALRSHSRGRGRQGPRCQSRMEKKGPIYAHVISDVWRRKDCGAKVSEDGRRYSITVQVQHYAMGGGSRTSRPRVTTHTLSCYYHTGVGSSHLRHDNRHHHVQDSPNTAGRRYAQESSDKLTVKRHKRRHAVSAYCHSRSRHRQFKNQDVHPSLDKDSSVGSANKDVLRGSENKEIPSEEKNDTRTGRMTGLDNKEIPSEEKNDTRTVSMTGLDNKEIPSEEKNDTRTGSMTGLDNKEIPFENKNSKAGLDNKEIPSENENIPTGSQEIPAGSNNHEDVPTRLRTRHTPPPDLRTKDSALESSSKDTSEGFLSPVYNSHYSSRLVNELDERMVVPVNEDVPLTRPLGLSKGYSGPSEVQDMTSSASVLQLNVVDVDGSMSAVVYPGKMVALELHAAQHNSLGVPSVRSCKVTNPLNPSPSMGGNVATPPFSSPIMLHGCGEGSIVPRGSGFTKTRQGFTSPYFPVPPTWTQQSALIFSCDVIICADVIRCQQKCPPQRRKPITAGLHDITILLESQVVTSCPSMDDVNNAGDVRWDQTLFPECLPEEHSLHKPLTPSGADHNLTTGGSVVAGGGSSSGMGDHSFPVFWLAAHLHYIVIISLLVLLLLIFMVALFCKMAAMQRQACQNRKEAAAASRRGGEEREMTDSDHQDQMTQTPRPLPRTPHARGHTPNRHSRQGGDGASVTVLQLDGDGHVAASHPSSGVPPPVFDHRRNSLPSPPAVPQQQRRFSGHPQPQPYDIPPTHEQQREYRSSIGSEPAHGTPFHFQTAQQRSSKVKSFQTSTTVEEKNSERHTTIIEIKSPGQREPLENGMAWSTPDHLTSFTGGGAASSSGNNTLERGVVLGVNSLRRHLDRENQQVPSQPRDRRPITAQQRESLTATTHPAPPQLFYKTPALCSEDSSLKELMLSTPPDSGSITAPPNPLGGIRTSPHRGSRKGGLPLVINTVEETTRL